MANGYAEDLTIDRIDVNGNYEPDNCRWITNKEQQNNKRNNHFLNFQGETKTVAQWADEVSISHKALRERLRRGWTIEEALTTPVGQRRKNK